MPFFFHDDQSSLGHAALRSAGSHHSSYGKLAVCPPQLFTRARPAWRRWLSRLWASLSHSQRSQAGLRASTRVQAVRERFLDILFDVTEPSAENLRERIEKARSLRELWHLRPETYDLLARYGGQTFAQQRLDILNSNFPVRVPQAGHCRPNSGRTVAW